MKFATLADDLSADLSDPPSEIYLQEALGVLDDAEDEEEEDDALGAVQEEARGLRAEIVAYDRALQRLYSAWVNERIRLEKILKRA